MKKMITALFLVCFAIHSYQAFNIKECLQEFQLEDLNSKKLLSYIKENNISDKIAEVCSNDICHKVSFSNLEQDIKDFIKQNIEYLKKKNEDYSLEAELKGFKIDKIIINSCL